MREYPEPNYFLSVSSVGEENNPCMDALLPRAYLIVVNLVVRIAVVPWLRLRNACGLLERAGFGGGHAATASLICSRRAGSSLPKTWRALPRPPSWTKGTSSKSSITISQLAAT